MPEDSRQAGEGERVAPRHSYGNFERGDRLLESANRSQRDAECPVRHERLGVLLNGAPAHLDRLVKAAGRAKAACEDHRDVGGQGIDVERAAGFRDALVELPAGPLETEERVPAAAQCVTRIELQRSLELLPRHRAVVLKHQGRTRQRGVARCGTAIELDRPRRCRYRL